MKLTLSTLMLCLALPAISHAQTTISNLDQDPISNPNSTNLLRTWGYAIGPGVGCTTQFCNPTGSEEHVNTSATTYSVDGDALQLNLLGASGCSGGGCYGDLDFSDKIYVSNATASNATNFTLDMYLTGDANWNDYSQATEFTIEQDVPSTAANASGMTDRYIYSMQCNRKGSTTGAGLDGGPPTGGIWAIWDGSLHSGAGGWAAAITTSGNTVPCDAFDVGHFIHYYFHFKRIASSRSVQFVDFTMVDDQGNSTYYPFDAAKATRPIQNPVPQTSFAIGLFTALQLDGDSLQQAYSVWADEWKVAYQ